MSDGEGELYIQWISIGLCGAAALQRKVLSLSLLQRAQIVQICETIIRSRLCFSFDLRQDESCAYFPARVLDT